jgi:hypothetical protein
MKREAGRQSVERYRGRMRAAGFRLIQLWVPDTRAPRFPRECRRQSRLASRHPQESEVLDEIELLHDDEGWTA